MSEQLVPRAPRHGLRTLVLVVALLALLAGAVFGGLYALRRLEQPSVADYQGSGTGSVVVQVLSGETAGQIAVRLAERGVVASAAAFNQAAIANPQSRSLQPGTYRLREHMSGSAALAMLLDPSSRLRGRVVLPEGITLSEALRTISTSAKLPLAQVEAAAKNTAALGLPDYAKGRLEGFLFPATYDVDPGTTAQQLLRTMVARYRQAAEQLDLTRKAQAIGRTPYEVLITASLIERETAYPPDRPKVARVVYNRLARGMPLQFDSTVNYVRAEKKARLSVQDLKVESDYNTYLHTGLPPTPIGSPGLDTLRAALNPASGNYIYFVTVSKTGQALFTADYNAFLRAKAKAMADGVY